MDKILDFIKNPGGCVRFVSWADLSAPFEVAPSEFLRCAEIDLEQNNPSSTINCLSNVKRALESQLDFVLYACGIYKRATKEGWNFPAKVDWVQAHDIIAPRILRKINKKRNLLEHEFKRPKREDVEDALDVASLFIAYSDGFVRAIAEEVQIEGDYEPPDHVCLAILFKPTEGIFRLLLLRGENDPVIMVEEEREVRHSEKEYDIILRYYLKVLKSWKGSQ
jgi:hypothetical protein